ncbi:Alpha/beta hydrolase [Fulvimarina pelagi HTCC2506]|uniref:Alpha/beta hydrolase n=1 Tax=Fulvimarina pelagi HTCC2506 TaxID=314231 RepID=Q0FYU2_9HYPH|nr:alpha/beta fold hydrolase BchO [Fulvimarina pelagi]EAU40216.1 Alpha/beta hydrolase [Fulvimarina pelagi HTCC2506]
MRTGAGRPPADWPLSEHSRSVDAGGIRWHFQIMGEGPAIMLIHGTGASTHSFRDLAPILAENHQVLMADCPGLGFTDRPSRSLTLQTMAAMHAELLQKLGVNPAVIVGHSAGAVIAIEMALDGRVAPQHLVSLNGALLPFPGLAGRLFPKIAKVVYRNPIVPRFFAYRAKSENAVSGLLDGTGSALTPGGKSLYARLFQDRHHVAGTLSMMSHWDLDRFSARLDRLETPLLLVTGDRDKAIPVSVSHRVAAQVKNGKVVVLNGLGHLAHEEAPGLIAELIFEVVGTS